jgi:phosphohistidine phosphatase
MDARRLTLLRHGEAQALDSSPEDFERTLTRRGNIEAQEIAERIVHHGLIPDLILVSPAERAWSTAEIVAAACELDAKQVQCARELYLATPEATWRLVVRRDPALRHVLICGHNPGLSQVASRLGPTPQRRNLPTGALATAVWHHALWSAMQPETAASCELIDPDSPLDL